MRVCEYCEKLQTVHLNETKIQITFYGVIWPICTSHKGQNIRLYEPDLVVIKTQSPFIIDEFLTELLPPLIYHRHVAMDTLKTKSRKRNRLTNCRVKSPACVI